jgi:hypothetical protein
VNCSISTVTGSVAKPNRDVAVRAASVVPARRNWRRPICLVDAVFMSPPYLCSVLPHYNGSGVRRALTFWCAPVGSVYFIREITPWPDLQSGLNFRHLRCLRTAGCGVSLGWAFVNRVLGRIFAVGAVCLALGGCATRPTDTNDPLEGMNRAFFDFNQG